MVTNQREIHSGYGIGFKAKTISTLDSVSARASMESRFDSGIGFKAKTNSTLESVAERTPSRLWIRFLSENSST